MSVLDLYAQSFAQCQAWADAGASAPFEVLAGAFPTVMGGVPFDPDAIAILFGSQTDLACPQKVSDFRANVTAYFQQLGSIAFEADCEPWYRKDMTQLMCEVLLFFDVSSRQQELLAMLVQFVIDFGRDAMAVVAFLLCARAFWRHGRADVAVAETEWLVQAAAHALARANDYLLSEYVGQVSLADLVQSL